MKKQILITYAVIVTVIGVILDALPATSYQAPALVYEIFTILVLPLLAFAIYQKFKAEGDQKIINWIFLMIAILAVGFFIRTTFMVLN
jgi:hypothetical protein